MEVNSAKELKKALKRGEKHVVYVIKPSAFVLKALLKLMPTTVAVVYTPTNSVVLTLGITFAVVVAYAIYLGYRIKIRVSKTNVEVEFSKK